MEGPACVVFLKLSEFGVGFRFRSSPTDTSHNCKDKSASNFKTEMQGVKLGAG